MWGEYKHPFSMTSIPKSSQFITKPCSSAPANTKQTISETGNAFIQITWFFHFRITHFTDYEHKKQDFRCINTEKERWCKNNTGADLSNVFKNKSLKAFFNTSASVCRCPIM